MPRPGAATWHAAALVWLTCSVAGSLVTAVAPAGPAGGGVAVTVPPLGPLLGLFGASSTPPAALGHVAAPANASFAEDDLMDSKKTSRLEGGVCTAELCQAHCRARQHAAGRCDQDVCVCRDLKQRGRCQGVGCGVTNSAGEGDADGRSIVNNNNNNVLVVH